LSYKATFSLSHRWPLNTGLTVHIVWGLYYIYNVQWNLSKPNNLWKPAFVIRIDRCLVYTDYFIKDFLHWDFIESLVYTGLCFIRFLFRYVSLYKPMLDFQLFFLTKLVLLQLNITGQLYFIWGPTWSWSYGSWIYNNLCNRCLSSQTL
jgi:hypothetical protein